MLAGLSAFSMPFVVTDVVMPRMGGLALTEELLKTRRDTKGLYVTGFSETTAFNAAQGSARRQVLFKPYSQEALAMRVRQILDGTEFEANGVPQRLAQ